MSALGALPSANFFSYFDEDQDDNHWHFSPLAPQPSVDHSGMLSNAEKKLIAEWLDLGAKQ